MSAKNLDRQGRLRSVTVGFRVSPGEAKVLDAAVHLSGKTKQAYIMSKLQDLTVVVQPSPKIYIALKKELAKVLAELQKINDTDEIVDRDLLEIIRLITSTMADLGKES